VFHFTKVDTSVPKTGLKENALVIIALTKLDYTSGLFKLLEGSHQQTPEHPSVEKLKKADFILEPGDAVIWRGDLSYYHTSGAEGKFKILVYDIQG
jgi:ectoine hydroxylase-related dioxygenase (phytanoyl-CoA dioxygenase family)